MSKLIPQPIPEIHVSGTYYEVGYAIGEKFSHMFHGFLAEDTTLNQQLLPFIATAEGKSLYNSYISVAREFYPQYVAEIQGMADGSGAPFTKLFVLTLRNELKSVLALEQDGEEGCTDIYLRASHQFMLGHNEDLSSYLSNRIFVVHASIYSEKTPNSERELLEHFIAVQCAGMTSGHTFSIIHGAGLAYSINNLYPEAVEPNKIPRQLLNRALLASRDLSSFLEIMHCRPVGIANGCCTNVVIWSDNDGPQLWTVEVAPIKGEPASWVTSQQFAENIPQTIETFYHANRYELMEVPEIPMKTMSSETRLARIKELPVPSDIEGIKLILGDEVGEKRALYQRPLPSGGSGTVFTAIVDLIKQQAYLFSDNPKLCQAPSNILRLATKHRHDAGQ